MYKPDWDDIHHRADTCALTGAAAFFAGIPDAAVVANGPLWCYFYALRYLENNFSDIGRRYYCTQTDGQAVVHGTEDLLRETLEMVRNSQTPAVMLLENSCSVGLIGDDATGIIRQMNLPWPSVCLDAGGLDGGFAGGYQAAARAYFENMPLALRRTEPGTVNLLGCTPAYLNGDNDCRELRRLLELSGYRVLACPGAGSSVDEMINMASAELNIVVHQELAGELAEFLCQKYQIPYISPDLPYGIDGTRNWLESVRLAMSIQVKTGKALQQEMDDLRRRTQTRTLAMQMLWGEMHFRQTLVAGPLSVAMGMARALREEWSDTGPLTVVVRNKIPEGFRLPDGIECLDDGNDSVLIKKRLQCMSGALVMASSNEKALLLGQGVTDAVCMNIAFPVYDEVFLGDTPFMGLRGSAAIQEKLWNHYIGICQHKAVK